MKFVHIADVHFDVPFSTISDRAELGQTRRLEQREAFKKVIEFIKENNIEYLFISGDLYEQLYVRKSTIIFINNLFKEIPNTKIYITPGNHDPYIKASYYNCYEWEKNVKIFTSQVEKIENEDAIIYGFGFDNYEMNKNQLNEIVIEQSNKPQILITHGTIVSGNDTKGIYNPMSAQELLKKGFDYIALGHIHKRDEVYSGSLISLGFDEPGEHGFICGEIINKKLYTKFIKIDNREFVKKEFDVSDIYSEEELIEKLNRIDLNQVMNLYENANNIPLIDERKIEHIEYTDLNSLSEEKFKEYKNIGIDVIKNNKYAVITMAGGQGTRLGHKGPKGTFKINTVNGEKYLFEIIVESLQKANKKYNVVIPWYIMTSEDNNDQTIQFLKENNFFGYDENKVKFFKQGKVPMVKEDGNIVIDQNKLIKEASDGNGSIYKSLKDANLINQMKEDGIEWIFVGGVDNILLKIVDPVLTGLTITENNLISSKSVVKKNAKERVGVFCKLNGVPKVIEYTELPEKMAEEIDSNGQLMYGEVNILSHLFNIKALEKLSEVDLPYHTAYKKSNYLDEKGNFVEVTTPNAYKFESYIFDGFSFFNSMSILRVKREEQFAPIKNREGSDSPETAVNLYNEYVKKYN